MEDKFYIKITDLLLPPEKSKINRETVPVDLHLATEFAGLFRDLYVNSYTKFKIPKSKIPELFKIEIINDRTKESQQFYPEQIEQHKDAT